MNRTIGLICGNYEIPAYDSMVRDRPPVSMPYGGRFRLMDFALSNMVNSRIQTVGFITPYRYRSILDHIGAGKEWGMDKKQGGLYFLPGTVSGVRNQNTRFLFRDFLHNLSYFIQGDGDYVLVTTGTMVANIDFQPMIAQHELSGLPVTLMYRKRGEGEKGRVCSLDLTDDGRVRAILPEEKTGNLFLDTFIIDRTLVLKLAENYANLGHMDLMHILRESLDSIPMGSWCFDGYVNFADGKQDYYKASMDLLKAEVRHELFNRDRPITTKIHDAPPAVYAKGSNVRNSVITTGSYIEGTVQHSIVFRDVKVEKGAEVRGCVLMEGTVVKAGAILENVIVDKDVTVSVGTVLRSTGENLCVIPKGASI